MVTATAQKTILIVDDHEATTQMLRLALETDGYRVETARSGIKLLKTVREMRPDLILMDVMMPFVDGFDLTRAVRETPEGRTLPIFIISARTENADIERGYEAGATEYFEKPIELRSLMIKIELAVQAARQ